MLEFHFFIEDDEEIITGYELGRIKLKSYKCIYELNDSKKYFMVFLTISALLDSIYSLYRYKGKNKTVICVDSSFYLEFIANKNDTTTFYALDTHIGDFDKNYFLNKLYNDCSRFCKKYINKLDFDRSVKNDIESSMKNIELLIR